jgi:hypothetical protein
LFGCEWTESRSDSLPEGRGWGWVLVDGGGRWSRSCFFTVMRPYGMITLDHYGYRQGALCEAFLALAGVRCHTAFLEIADRLAAEVLRDFSTTYEMPAEPIKWISDMIEYNVKGGKLNRGLTVGVQCLLYAAPDHTVYNDNG